jgi:hypothetical protein
MLMLYAVAVGMAVAGLTGSLWAIVAGGWPITSAVLTRDLLMPLRVMVLVLHAPILLVRAGTALRPVEPLIALAAFAAGGIWCFFQGVFILTSLFGVP